MIGTEAYVLHQIVTWLRGTQGYGQVNLIGHSPGSVISIAEAGTYQDVSRVVVTGLLHLPNIGIGFATTLESLLYPARLDPQFITSGLGPGYLTTIPGDRGKDFYSAAADPAVIAYDEALGFEAPYYADAASLVIDTIADTGHDLALHPSADESFGLINEWIMTH